MNNIEWLKQTADVPIRCNLKYLTGEKLTSTELEHLFQNKYVIYWLNHLQNASETLITKIQGCYDYRYENFMGKLYTLGLRAGMAELDQYTTPYIDLLHKTTKRKQLNGIYSNEIFELYDHELVIAAFLAMLGYTDDSAVNYVVQKRVDILYEFTKKRDYHIYVTHEYPGVNKEWQRELIKPKLYFDNNVRIPTVHDYYLFAAIYKEASIELQEKIDVIAAWLFDEKCNAIRRRYGYFYLPNDSRRAKAVTWKLTIPDINSIMTSKVYPSDLLQTMYLLSTFRAGKDSYWMTNLLTYLESFKTCEGRYRFKKTMLMELPDYLYVIGRHMGVGENRDDPKWVEIESTYWMEMILHKIGYCDV